MEDLPPLVETPDAKAPPGGEAAWFTGAGGARLRAALFTPRGRPRGSIVLSGGRSEPIEKYYETIGDFLARGFVVLAHDWRGQGFSRREPGLGLKGHAAGFNAFLDDFQALLAAYQARLPKPWVAVGHSMGGCLTLLAMANGESRFAGAVLSAPMLGLNTGRVGRATAQRLATLNVLLGRGRRYVLGDPGKPFDDNFEANVLTHDRTRYARTVGLLAAEPGLALGAPTWGWLDFAFQAMAQLARPERLRSVTVPVVIVSAELDKLVDNAAQAAAARHLPQGKLITVPGAFHEILMETDEMRNFFQKAFDALTGRVAAKPPEAPKPAAAATPAAAPAQAAAPAPAPAATAPKPAAAPTAAATAKPATSKPAASKRAARKPVDKSAAAPKAVAAKPAAKAAAPKPAAAAKASAPKAAAAKRAAKSKAAKPASVSAPAASAKTVPAPKAAAKPPAAKPASAKPAATKAAAKPAAAKAAKPASVKPAPAKPASAKPAAKKPAAKKPAARKAAVKK